MSVMVNRRQLLRGTVSLLGSGAVLPQLLRAQVPNSGVKPSGRYESSMIIERKPYTWPGGKFVAIWIAPNVEVLEFERGTSVLAYSTQDYGIRVGLWRIADV